MQSSAGLICVIIKFAAGVKCCEHNALRAHTFFMHSDRNASAVVLHRAGAVRFKGHFDRGAESGKVFVDGVVHDLVDQVVESSCGDAADIHAGPDPDSFQAFEYLDTAFVVTVRFLIYIRHSDFLFLCLCPLFYPSVVEGNLP